MRLLLFLQRKEIETKFRRRCYCKIVNNNTMECIEHWHCCIVETFVAGMPLIEFRKTNHARIESSADCVEESNNSNFGRHERNKNRKDRRKIGLPAVGLDGLSTVDKCTLRCLAVSFERNEKMIELVGRIFAVETDSVENYRGEWMRTNDGFARFASKAVAVEEGSHHQ